MATIAIANITIATTIANTTTIAITSITTFTTTTTIATTTTRRDMKKVLRDLIHSKRKVTNTPWNIRQLLPLVKK
jgi:hypothetical protein